MDVILFEICRNLRVSAEDLSSLAHPQVPQRAAADVSSSYVTLMRPQESKWAQKALTSNFVGSPLSVEIK